MSFGVVLFRIIILLIPGINVAAAFVWAYGSGNEGTRRFGRTALLIILVLVVLAVLFGVFGLFSLKGIRESLGG